MRVEHADARRARAGGDRADLRYRGFSQDRPRERTAAGDSASTTTIANVSQRWRDLVGYYTRFGDVRELLAAVDDRYVIMNAGDELRLSFPAPAPPPAGWTRDFVLVGDGWVKDGDYNTSFSKTVAAAAARTIAPTTTRPPSARSRTIRSIGGIRATGRPITRDS